MEIHLIAVHYDDKNNIIGFRLLDTDNGQVMDQPYNAVKNVVCSKKAKIIGIKKSGNDIKGSNGTFERYPVIFNNQLKRQSVVILGTIDDYGYRVCNFEGNIIDEYTNKIIELCNNIPIANGKLVEKDNSKFISAISGQYINIPIHNTKLAVRENNKIKNREYAKKIKDIVKEEQQKEKSLSYDRRNNPRLPKFITGAQTKNSKLKEVDEETGMTVEQKFTYIMLAVQETRPLAYGILSLLKRVECDEAATGIDTMAVSLGTLYFSSKFIKESSLSDLLFVFLHETYHVAMKHFVRGKDKEADAWNIACDYFINKCLAEEFMLSENNEASKANTGAYSKEYSQYQISLPSCALYNSAIDVNKDTPEKIYEELLKQNKQQSEQNQDQNQQDKDNQQQSGNNKQQGGQGQQSQNNQQQSRQSQSQQGQGQGQGQEQGKGQQGQDQDQQSQNNQQQNKQGQQSQNNQQQNKNTEENNSESNDKQEGRFVGKEFRGQQIKETTQDMVEDSDSAGKTKEQIEQMQTTLLNQAVTIYKQKHSFGGDTPDFLERYLEKALAPKINWRSVLRRFLTKASQKEYTFAHPDRRFLSRSNPNGSRQVFAGPHNSDGGELENIKVCVDTSGSISPEDLGIALSQIKDLLKQYSADAELLYWDTRIRAVYPFKDIKDLLNKKPMGGGGTDANCIFEYFEQNKEYKYHKKPKPSLILVFTDGCFGEINSKYRTKYKNTIWIIQGNRQFNVPFGIKAPLKNSID